jgi:hypothetical protein
MEPTLVSSEDFRRLEHKVDKLGDAIQRLILIEERQNTMGARIGKCEADVAICTNDISRTDKKVDQWVNRGIGLWAAAAALYAILQYLTIKGN